MAKPMKIDFVSDVSCPWCIVGLGGLEEALRNVGDLVEADIHRFKRVIDDAPRSRAGGRRSAEVAIAVRALNRMLELGRPEHVRLA